MTKSEVKYSITIPVYNEASRVEDTLKSLYDQVDKDGLPIAKEHYEVVIAYSPSQDGTKEVVLSFKERYPEFNLDIVDVKPKGLVPALITGMKHAIAKHFDPFAMGRGLILLLTHADCVHQNDWLYYLVTTLESSDAAISVSSCYYDRRQFLSRPRLWSLISRTMNARDKINEITGGLPEGRGYAVYAKDYVEAGGIKEFYQLSNGKFIDHCSDDMDFGAEIREMGKSIVFAKNSKVRADSRRVDQDIALMIKGLTYGKDGILS
ncbi:MAG: glycosyltransferase family 2 protein [Myxococcales bacterium]|nr:MAG: glycosyltransferase family 2 protein [Myxococcales bacterium]